MWYVYIVKCKDSSYYTGISTNLAQRIRHHNAGKGSQYTRIKKPVELVYFEICVGKKRAELREIKIKKLSIKNKLKLIDKFKNSRFPSAKDSLGTAA